VVTKEEGAAGIALVQDLMGEVFATKDLKNGDEEERRMFVQYARAVQATGSSNRIVVSQLVAPGTV
jgi:hypothetical protein